MIEWHIFKTHPPTKSGRYLCAMVAHYEEYEFMNYKTHERQWFFNGDKNLAPTLWAEMPHINELSNKR